MGDYSIFKGLSINNSLFIEQNKVLQSSILLLMPLVTNLLCYFNLAIGIVFFSLQSSATFIYNSQLFKTTRWLEKKWL